MEPHGGGERGGVATVRRPGGEPAAAGDLTPGDGPRRLAGLDGLRALAVVAVVVFHLDPTWLPGGFLGVDVFFVVSGFLITTLLVREHRETGRVDLRAFWARRARRLLPALLLVVPSAVLLARLAEGDLLVGVGRQVLGALTFTSNWLEIGAGSDYFASTSPVLLANLWSLAVEEQFYLLWPPALLLLLLLVARPSPRVAVVGALAAASALAMAWRLDPEHPTRVYYGTDTHAMGLMVGAALALALASPARAGTRSAGWARHRRLVGAVALVVLLGSFVVADERSALTFRGGILLVSLATAALVLVVVERPGRLRALLEVPAARWVGSRSYGIYLWHWPVVLVVGRDLPVAPGGTEYVLTRLWAVLVTLAAADLSYRFVETPVRRRGVRGAFAGLTRRLRAVGTRRARVAWAVVATVAVAVPVVLLTAPERSSVEESLVVREAALSRQTASAGPTPGGTRPSAAPSARTSTPAADTAAWAMPSGAEIDGFGDSMLVGASDAMEYWFDGIRLDARSNRRWSQAPSLVENRGPGLRRAVVLAFGTNFGTDEKAIAATLDAIGPDRMVVIVTVHGRYARAESDNRRLRSAVARRDNVQVADWDAALAGTRGMLQSDDIHPSIRGAHLYSSTVRQAFATLSERHTGRKVTLPAVRIP
ncbi:acyltransferase family protein [Phycicoccus duodecadis]|uniref:Peptidoglycan/LPS O-acetylase OafA/YrhL n=1 Tax=Phycicoccus duodecadis TaxID=173053 RepID=A0A2N3YGA9_9MICO|nr:acyltransferase family protein [Phycicoccus duodecadis]PKW25891.1 peptidoglycan/LPS O-acetylase OafA/YrhL [Phycicoccus duodecadis]